MDKVLDVRICMCNECVMNGAVDIMESLEKMDEVSAEIKETFNVEIKLNLISDKCIGESKHGNFSPRVSIEGKTFNNADSQTVMEEIIASMSKELV
ncbi:MAG: hypothetical protein WBI17_10215 [Clostridiaceae bacterium]